MELGNIETIKEERDLLKRQRDYLIKYKGIVPARVTWVDYDPAGSTTEYEEDKEGIELFGKENMFFVTGGSTTYFSLITKNLKP